MGVVVMMMVVVVGLNVFVVVVVGMIMVILVVVGMMLVVVLLSAAIIQKLPSTTDLSFWIKCHSIIQLSFLFLVKGSFVTMFTLTIKKLNLQQKKKFQDEQSFRGKVGIWPINIYGIAQNMNHPTMTGISRKLEEEKKRPLEKS